MKLYIPLLSLITCSCCCCKIEPTNNPNIVVQISEPKRDFSDSETASNLIKRMLIHDYEKWQIEIQKIRNTYARVIKVLDDKETIQFTVAFFKSLCMSEDLDRQIFTLSNKSEQLPNMDSLKYFYSAEKELDGMIAILTPFTNSTNSEIYRCAVETEKYFQYQKNLLAAVRDVDYRDLKALDIPLGIPPDVLKANAKLLEQRDQMAKLLISFYANLAN